LGGFGAGGAAILGIAGGGGIGNVGGTGGAGKDGREATGNAGAAGILGEASFCAPEGPAGGFTEMIRVYALGPLAVSGWLGGTSLTGRLNA
jgi:hypothetical protein